MKIYIAAAGVTIAAIVWMFAALIATPYGTVAVVGRPVDIAGTKTLCVTGPLHVRGSTATRCIPNT